MTKQQKKKWYAGGRPTAAQVPIYDNDRKEFKIVWLPRLRGNYVRFGKAKYHETKESALEDARAFRDAMATPLESP